MNAITALLLPAVVLILCCQAPLGVLPSEPGRATIIEQSDSDLPKLIATYRCYRLTGRLEEARGARAAVEAAREKAGLAIGLLQQLEIVLALRESRSIAGVGNFDTLRRYKQACGEHLGIYELTLRRAPLTGRPSCIVRPRTACGCATSP